MSQLRFWRTVRRVVIGRKRCRVSVSDHEPAWGSQAESVASSFGISNVGGESLLVVESSAATRRRAELHIPIGLDERHAARGTSRTSYNREIYIHDTDEATQLATCSLRSRQDLRVTHSIRGTAMKRSDGQLAAWAQNYPCQKQRLMLRLWPHRLRHPSPRKTIFPPQPC
jgi:hypothetical protein